MVASVLGSACSYLPLPGGEGNATVEPGGDPAPAAHLVASPRAAAHAAVDAWKHDDMTTMDRVSTAGATRIIARPYPDPAPRFVNCSPDVVIAEAIACYFWTREQMVVVVSVPTRSDRWEVVSIRFRPGRTT